MDIDIDFSEIVNIVNNNQINSNLKAIKSDIYKLEEKEKILSVFNVAKKISKFLTQQFTSGKIQNDFELSISLEEDKLSSIYFFSVNEISIGHNKDIVMKIDNILNDNFSSNAIRDIEVSFKEQVCFTIEANNLQEIENIII